MKGLTYIGRGRFIVGIPATDLTAAQLAALAAKRGESIVKLRARLIASGCYTTSRRTIHE